MDREIELKLELDPGTDPAALERMFGEAANKRLDATYFDTTDQTLRKIGASLRIRRSGEMAVQTLKLAGGSLLDRREWERPAVGERPSLEVFGGERPDVDVPWERLEPAFTVVVDRAVWPVRRDAALVELVLDRGAVRAGAAEWPVLEAELELRDGGRETLFAVAREAAEALPVRLGVLSKAERGYRLVSGEAARAAKAEALRLDPDMSGADAFAAIVAHCVRHFRMNEPLVLGGRDPAALHQARVALRRLRSAFSLFGKMLAGEQVAGFRAALRALAGRLGEARDLDVLLARLAVGDGVRERLQAERDRAYDRVTEELNGKAARVLMLDLVEWAELRRFAGHAAFERPADVVAADLLERYRKRVRKRGRHLKKLSEHDRHQVRIEGKKLRYAVDFFGSLFDGENAARRRKAFLKPLEAMQEALGQLNDYATGEAMALRLAALGIPVPPALDEDRSALLAAAADAWHDLVDAKRFWRGHAAVAKERADA